MTGFPSRSPAAGLEVAPGTIQVWSIRLDPPAERVEQLGRFLAADEWQRANRFRFEKHRRQYVVGRGALRTLLAAYLGIRPQDVQFIYGPRGKPFLAPPLDAAGLQFNLSNSDELALVGFVRGPEIGVDIEYLRPMDDCEQIAERFFSASERRVLRDIPFPAKQEAFKNAPIPCLYCRGSRARLRAGVYCPQPTGLSSAHPTRQRSPTQLAHRDRGQETQS